MQGPWQPSDHIRYSKQLGFSGILPQDKEQWLRKYPHIDDFELAVEEGHEWVSRYWDKARRAEERPREFLDGWLGGEWIPVGGYKEPAMVYNPEQLSDFIEQYFKAGELIERATRGKHNGFSESLASKHYEKVLGHAVKLREAVPDFPATPPATGNPTVDLRKLQEWTVECGKMANCLPAKVRIEDIERVLGLLRELDNHLKSGFPDADTTALARIAERVQADIEGLVGIIGELKEAGTIAADRLESKVQYWLTCVTWGQELEPLLEKMQQHGISVPNDKAELIEMLHAAEWRAKTDWNKVREITEEGKGNQREKTPIDKLAEQMRILEPAKTAGEKIGALAYKRYCRENPDYDKALREAQERVVSLYNGAADAINSQQDLAKIIHLRNGTLESAFKRLYDALFGTSFHRSAPDESLRDAVEELQAICETVRSVLRPSAASKGPEVDTMQQLRSFIVHGHDEAAMLDLKDYLQNTLGLPEPVILEQQASRGRTIIEKFEEHSASIDVAFVLLTPDDVGGSCDDALKNRARQNVIFELGVFVGRFGRRSGRVILLYKADLEIPSDLAGVAYVDVSHGVRAAGERIRKELSALTKQA